MKDQMKSQTNVTPPATPTPETIEQIATRCATKLLRERKLRDKATYDHMLQSLKAWIVRDLYRFIATDLLLLTLCEDWHRDFYLLISTPPVDPDAVQSCIDGWDMGREVETAIKGRLRSYIRCWRLELAEALRQEEVDLVLHEQLKQKRPGGSVLWN